MLIHNQCDYFLSKNKVLCAYTKDKQLFTVTDTAVIWIYEHVLCLYTQRTLR